MSLVVYIVIRPLIGPSAWASITSTMNTAVSVSRNGEQTRPGSLAQMLHDWFGAHVNGPIRWGITLLATNEIAELVVFYEWSFNGGAPLT